MFLGQHNMDMYNDYIRADGLCDIEGNVIHPEHRPLTICRQQRQHTYNIGHQLDCLWHDIDNGLFGEAARSGEFYQYVASIKAAIPKPEGSG